MEQNLRQANRRLDERRIQEKRKIKFAFGSREWVEEIQKHYTMWPKEDRRRRDRRRLDRRNIERRILPRVGGTLTKKGVGLLSEDEKKMLNELISSR